MCRLLCVRAERPFQVNEYLRKFAEVARQSKEYQGHGWGYAWWNGLRWSLYRNVKPIWEDSHTANVSTSCLLAHVRSAFENRDISVENNMPFADERWAFAFNGELRGVRMKVDGRIGAEKVFNLIRLRKQQNMRNALTEAVRLLQQRTVEFKACNVIVSDGNEVYLASRFTVDDEYYTLRRKVEGERLLICSAPFAGETDWEPIEQGIEQVV